MKVLHILYSGLGGPYNVVETLVSQYDPKLINQKLYVGPELNSDLSKKKNNLKPNIYYVKTKRFFSQFFFLHVLNKIIKITPNIIVLHNFQILACIIAKLFLKTKIIYVDHNALIAKNYKDYLVLHISKLFVSHYVCLNEDNKKYLINTISVKKNKISIIRNGIKILKNK